MEPLCVSVAEAARVLGIGLTKTWALIGEDKLRSKKLGRRTVVTTKSIRELVEAE